MNLTRLAIAIIVSTALLCDLIANVAHADSVGWDWTATIIAVWGYFAWKKESTS